jgi:hypothetical protein
MFDMPGAEQRWVENRERERELARRGRRASSRALAERRRAPHRLNAYADLLLSGQAALRACTMCALRV